MTTTQILDSHIVINTVEEGDHFDEVIDYVKANRQRWARHNVLWDVTVLFEAGESFSNEVQLSLGKLADGPDRKGRKTALLVGSDLAFGLARMFKMMARSTLSSEISIFRSKDEAMAWLLL